MAILSTELLLRLSGGACNTNPDCALGGVKSTTTSICPAVAEENLFNNVDGAEACAGSTKYRGLYLHNNNGTLTLNNSVVWLPTNTPSTDTEIRIALAGEGLNGTMEVVANECTAPVGEVFCTPPATKCAGLSTGNVPTMQHYGVWFRRVVTACAAAYDNDDWQVQWEGDTAA